MTNLFNPGDSPVVISDEGHQLGGGEWLDTEVTEKIQSLLDSETLLLAPEAAEETPAEDSKPEAETPKPSAPRANDKKK